MNFFEAVYEAVKRVPKGKVATFGQIASLCNNPRASRAVGWALHVNPQPGVIPCHRIVTKQGYLSRAFAFGGAQTQKALLEAEGVKVDADYRVDMKEYQWNGE